MNKKIFELQADVCKVLSHPIRMEIIHLLREEELCFSRILEITGCLKSNLSQHIKIMVEKGVLKVRRDGQYRHYSLLSKKVAQACQLMHEVLFQNIQKQQELLKNS
jgi:DNA-binding transcriptional ArsR family regulator